MHLRALAYVATVLVITSNAIKGTVGLYALQRDPLNGVSAGLLSVGVEVMAFFATMRWSEDRVAGRTVRLQVTIALAMAICATTLNWLFFGPRLAEPMLAIALSAIGPVVSVAAGLVIGDTEGAERAREDMLAERAHAEQMAAHAAEIERQQRLTVHAQRRLAEAQQAQATSRAKKPKNNGRMTRAQFVEAVIDDRSLLNRTGPELSELTGATSRTCRNWKAYAEKQLSV